MSENDKAEDQTDAPEDASTEENVDVEETGQEAEEQPKGKLAGKLKYIIAAAVVLVFGGTLGGLYAFGVFHAAKPHEATIALPGEPKMHDMKTMTVNLKPSEKRARPFIRLTLQIELEGETAKQAFIANETKIIDQFQTHLRGIQHEDLEGSEGLQRLREDFTIIINRIIQPERAITVFYKDIFTR